MLERGTTAARRIDTARGHRPVERQKHGNVLPECNERETFSYRILCTIKAYARVRHGLEYVPFYRTYYIIILYTKSSVSHANLQEDACLRRPRNSRRM